jgi:hypothetical protein
MFQKKLFRLLMPALVITLILSGTFVNVASADDGKPPPPTPVVIRQGGPVVHSEPAMPIGDSLLFAATVYRAGWTDAYWVWYYPLNIEHHGSHNSQSDLVETNIWADGSLKIKGVTVHSCANHTSGQYAQCETNKSYYEKNAITAKSWHYFHTSGYTDQNFTTSKTVNP